MEQVVEPLGVELLTSAFCKTGRIASGPGLLSHEFFLRFYSR